MSFGLSTDGFEPKTIDDVLASIRSKQLALFGAAFAAQLDTSVVGQLNGVYAAEIADLWDLALSVWRSRYPSIATGQSLDLLAEETGAVRLAAKKSTGSAIFTGTNLSTIPIGTIIRVAATDARFLTTELGTISGTTTTVTIASEEYGEVIGASGTITDIVTPVAGITSVTNALDVTVGRDIETDAAFRLRRASLLQIGGESTISAIRSDLLAVTGVDEVFVFNNPSDATDSDGIPPHSFEAVVRGGADQGLWNAVLNSSPAGIQSHGTEVGTAEDVQGDTQTVSFTRAADVLMYAEVTLTRDAVVYGGGVQAVGDAAVKQAIIDYWLAFDQRIGKDVITNAFYGTVYAIPGVLQVTVLKVDDTMPATTTATTTIGPRSIAVFDTSRVTVTS